MSQSIINDSTLTAIADAINAKAGTTGKMKPTEMADKIAAIPREDTLLKYIAGEPIGDITYSGTVIKNSSLIGAKIDSFVGNNVTLLESYAFQNATIGSIELPNVSTFYSDVLRGDTPSIIEELNFPNLVSVGNNTFYERKFISGYFGKVRSWNSVGAFYHCYKTERLTFPELIAFNNGASWANGLGDENNSADGKCHLYMPKMSHSSVLGYTAMLSTCGRKCVFHCELADVAFIDGAWVSVERS